MEVFNDIDNNEYELIELNKKLWSTSNFKASKFNDGTEIKLATSKNEWEDLLVENEPAYCYVDFDENNKEMGHIYNKLVIRNEKSILPPGFELPTIRDCEGLFDLAEIKSELQFVRHDLALMPEFISHDTWPIYTRQEWEDKLHTLENFRVDSREEKEKFLAIKGHFEEDIGFENYAEYRKGRNGLGLNIKNFSTTETPNSVYYYLKDGSKVSDISENMLRIKIYSGVQIFLERVSLLEHKSYFIRPVIDSFSWDLKQMLEEGTPEDL